MSRVHVFVAPSVLFPKRSGYLIELGDQALGNEVEKLPERQSQDLFALGELRALRPRDKRVPVFFIREANVATILAVDLMIL